MLANQRFIDLLWDVEPSATTKRHVSAARTSVSSHLQTHETFKDRWIRDFLAGSNARDTALRPKSTVDGVDRPDVDLCVETDFSTSDDPTDVLYELRDSLKKGGFDIERVNKRSVRVSMSYAEIDVVPLVASGTMYELPDRDLGYWKLTDPPRHNTWSSEQNALFDGRLKPLVKLFKTFRRENETGKRPKGFVLEVLASMYAPMLETHYGEAFTQLLEGIHRAYSYTVPLEIVPSITDPALSSNNILSKVTKTDWINFMERVRVHAGYARRAQDEKDIEEGSDTTLAQNLRSTLSVEPALEIDDRLRRGQNGCGLHLPGRRRRAESPAGLRMNLWWVTDSARFWEEVAAIDNLAGEGWFFVERRYAKLHLLTVEGKLRANGHEYPVRLVYPDQYPFVPPWVEPQDATAQWSTHQYGRGGTLCLETRPETWVLGMSAVDVLRSARRLLETENLQGDVKREVPVDHRVGEIQAYDYGLNVVFVSAACLARVQAGSSSLRAQRWFVTGDLVPIILFDQDELARGAAPQVVSSSSVSQRAEVPVLISRAVPPVEAPTDPADLSRISGVDSVSAPDHHILVMTGAETIAAYAVLNGVVYSQRVAVLAGESGARAARPVVARKKRVGIVGLGSMGSKIAEMLVRSGIERILLVDGDVFLPENLERHVLDWRDVGARKVDALKGRLLEIAPTTSIETIAHNLDWQRSARTHAWQVESLCECDVIVDATGDVPSTLFSGALAFQSERAFVSAEVFDGGIGALIGHSVPKMSPSYAAGRGAYYAYCDERAAAPPERGPRRYEALSPGGEVFVADDAAVTTAAGHAARTILDILDGGDVRREWMLLGFKKAWLFEHHGHNVMLDVGAPPAPLDVEASPEGLALAIKLARDASDAVH